MIPVIVKLCESPGRAGGLPLINYFYGDFLMGQGEFRQAIPYLEKADKASIRPQSRLSDLKLKEELKRRLKAAQKQNDDGGDFFSSLLPSFDEGPDK